MGVPLLSTMLASLALPIEGLSIGWLERASLFTLGELWRVSSPKAFLASKTGFEWLQNTTFSAIEPLEQLFLNIHSVSITGTCHYCSRWTLFNTVWKPFGMIDVTGVTAKGMLQDIQTRGSFSSSFFSNIAVVYSWSLYKSQ